MVAIDGTNSLVFKPLGERFTYHTTEAESVELEALKNVLAFCGKLGEAFQSIVPKESTWWTEPLSLTGDAELRVSTEHICEKANEMLTQAAVRRSRLGEIREAFGSSVLLQTSMTPFTADPNPNGGAEGPALSFTVKEDDTATRIYYIGGDGKVHCTGLLPVYVNGEELTLTDTDFVNGEFADGAVKVFYSVDFVVKDA
jgi:hypothetical protein